MTNEEMAAVLLMSLGEDAAAKVIKNFGERELARIGKHMNGLTQISGNDVEAAAREFCMLAKQRGRASISVEEDAFANIMTKALGEERGREILQLSQGEGRKLESPVIQKLKDTDVKTLTEATKIEHPQTAALILAHLKPDQAAEIMESFSPEKQEDIAKRIATLGSVPREFMEDLASSLESEVVTEKDSVDPVGGAKVIAEILNRMSQSNEGKILGAFEKEDPELAVEIRAVMFTFEDIAKLDDRSMRTLLSEVNREDLPRAFKVADNELKEKVFNCLSSRGAEMLREDLAEMPPIRLSEVEKSQKAILEVAKRLEAEEKIVLTVADEDDVWV